MKRDSKKIGVIIIIAALLVMTIFTDMWIVFRMTSQQTRESGANKLVTISGKLEGTINDAEKLTMEIAVLATEYLDDQAALERFLYAKKKEVIAQEIGAFNVYMAGQGWAIIPDFDMPDDYRATERSWYTGAMQNKGKPYVTSPYMDAMTGDICYTVSVLLGDGDTVCALDYTMHNIQEYIRQMYEAGSHNAVIVTEDGIIAGCSDETLIGKRLNNELPDFSGIFSLAKNNSGVATSRIKADVFYDILFAAKSGSGWYLIVSEGAWEMYKSSYLQLLAALILLLALFAVIMILYGSASRSRKNAEYALATKEEFLQGITGKLTGPLGKILDISSTENVEQTDDFVEDFARIHAAGERLSEMIGQIMSYSSIIRTEKKTQEKRFKAKGKKAMNRKFRTLILILMALVMAINLYSNITASGRWGNVLIQSEVDEYEYQLSEWINAQKSILDMFCSVISTNPDMLNDYEGTVNDLNRITMQYPEISVSYMTNPELEHSVIMNNGWEGDADWHVEERQWYIDTLNSETGWNISAPYYDEQTGGYCLTFSERVYDDKTGEFLGNFGIDFFMDKLIDILGDSYSDTGYAFLVDTEGYIINHPYGKYQMSQEHSTNVSELSYGEVKPDGGNTLVIRDYDGTNKLIIASRNEATHFTVYFVSSIWEIYGRVVEYSLVCLITFLICMIMVYRLLTDLIKWQDDTNRQMQDAADAAIAAGKAKSQFLAQMSHEIRTPINAVLGMNEMILRKTKDEEILDYSENIQNAGRTLLSIINSILDFSKIEDGKMEIIPVKYDMASMINNLVHTISDRAKGKGLELVLDIDERLPAVLVGDDVRISQVIMNLLTNAVKYTEKGKVTLSLKDGGRGNAWIDIFCEVRDTGIGIRKEDMGKLFESFERLEENRNRNIEGTGLGMSIVTKLLEMMGSKLSVESVYGEGSAFSFTLRQAIVDGQPIGNYMERLKVSRKEKNDLYLFAGDARILVVDDNEMNRKVAFNLLKLSGIEPDLASGGMEAVQMVRDKKYHMIFLDHMMPKMDGIETLKRIKDEKRIDKDTVVIALTANAIVGAKEMYLEKGFDDYLSKPIELEALQKQLKKYLPKEVVQDSDMQMSHESKKPTDAAPQDQEEEVLEFAPQGSEEEVPEFATQGLEEEVLEFAPQGLEEEVLEFAPQDMEEEILEFAPQGLEEEVLEFAPQGLEEEVPEFATQDMEEEILESSSDSAGEETAQVHTRDSGALLKELAAAGLNVEAGLRYCASDTPFYLEMLSDYTASLEDKQTQLGRYLNEQDLNNYGVLVHALKSTSRTIGAETVSDLALALEEAAKREDAEYIAANHEMFLQKYREMVYTITAILNGEE